MSRLNFFYKSIAVFCICFIIISAVIAARPLSLSEPPLFNPGRGFSMAVLLFGGISFGVPLTLASWLANFYFLKHSLGIAAFLALNNFVAMWIGALLVKKFCRERNPAKDPKDWAIFILGVLPISLMIRFALDALPLRLFNPDYPINWAQLYSHWIWIDALGLILSFPFFMECLSLLTERKRWQELSKDLIPFLIGNIFGVFVFIDPHFEKLGMPKYLPFYLALVGMIGIAYFANTLLVTFSVMIQSIWADWGREGILLNHLSGAENQLWDLRFFLFAVGIITPLLSSLFRRDNDNQLKENFALVASALSSRGLENNLLSVASNSESVGVGLFDLNFRCLFLNQQLAAMSGDSIEENLGRTSEQRLGPQNSQHVSGVFERVIKTGKPVWNYRINLKAWNKLAEQDVLANFLPVFSKKNEVVGAIVVATRVFQVENLREGGQENFNQEELITLALSHDLQEPFRNVAQSLRILNEKFKTSADLDVKMFIQSALENSTRIQSMIKGTLELAKIEARGLKKDHLNFQEVAEQSLIGFKNQLREVNAEVEFESLPQIQGDKELLIRLFQNLFSNAIKYRSGYPLRVKLTAQRQGNEYLFTLSDNGIGFESTHKERIFHLYQRLHSRDEIEGYGLGLSFCRKIVELHGGKMWAESQPGEGATFYFTLPVA